MACLPNCVEGTFLNTISSYLADRKQVVVVDGVKSDILEVTAGVPQGSRLGPLLFIIYMNDIIDDIESDILIFADDTSLMASGDIIFSKKYFNNLPPLLFDETVIDRVNTHKHLGLKLWPNKNA